MFYGFKGRYRTIDDRDELTGLGIISYDYKCVQKERFREGSKFSSDTFRWGIPGEVVADDEGDGAGEGDEADAPDVPDSEAEGEVVDAEA